MPGITDPKPVPDPPPHPPRLGTNRSGYSGERVEAGRILRAIRSLARQHRFDEHAATVGDHDLVFLSRLGRPGPRFYLSAGIHGDEPAGLVALHDLVRDDAWPADLNLGICPCLNPQGFECGTRENAAGLDLNRDYRLPRSAEVRLHLEWLASLPPWDLSICLHEDWESHGFYLYELNPHDLPSLAGPILDSVREVCPIDHSPWIDGRQAAAPGLIRPTVDPSQRPDWPESFWLLQNGCPRGYTLEAPSDWPLQVRARALHRAVQTAARECVRPHTRRR